MFKGLGFSRKHASMLLLVGVIAISLTMSQMHMTEGMETPAEPDEKKEEKKEEHAVQPAPQNENHVTPV